MFYEQFVDVCKARGEHPKNVISKAGLVSDCEERWKSGEEPSNWELKLISRYFGVSQDFFK